MGKHTSCHTPFPQEEACSRAARPCVWVEGEGPPEAAVQPQGSLRQGVRLPSAEKICPSAEGKSLSHPRAIHIGGHKSVLINDLCL